VDRLLLLSRAETGDAHLTKEDVDLKSLAEEVVAQLDVLAEEKQQCISIEANAALHWTGDRLVLRQALINLVDNAIKYTQAGGRIVIRVAQLGKTSVIDVMDNGPGIPESLRSRVFDRFYRVGQVSIARSRRHRSWTRHRKVGGGSSGRHAFVDAARGRNGMRVSNYARGWVENSRPVLDRPPFALSLFIAAPHYFRGPSSPV
jgi:K+-sensing histidine kinase KdpD